ncbi:hypothetical protein AY599_10445 [Leptolyngbya valderiana BDU 20041]|nr:hypothetical protein [Geitlerinema sp. CS-897]OAB60748.1 hypothetical protein AY599_10445 [Leptolyngbya valderiana BDU 20041]PPT10653.1 hypothetical protein CKA32_007010 [Geitlerinema sp. FC II]
MQHPNPYGSGSPNGQNPSVPLTVYRELAAELQATQAMLDSLHLQNQQLTRENQSLSQHNQQLQSEVAKVVNSTLHMKKVADALKSQPHLTSHVNSERVSPPRSPRTQSSDRPRETFARPAVTRPDKSSDLPPVYPNSPHVPQSMEDPSLSSSFSDSEFDPSANVFGEDFSDRGGLWLLAGIAAIVVTAFGAGYWLVRPLLDRQPSQIQPQQLQPPFDSEQ